MSSSNGIHAEAAADDAPNAARGVEAADSPQSDPRRLRGRVGRLKVMLVEDDALVLMGLRQHLESQGHEVVGQAASADEATELFLTKKPDIVLLDICLEFADKTDGIELAERLLSRRKCPMIIVSAFSDKSLIERAGEAGVFGYLIKPVSGDALAAQMEIAARRFAEHEQLLLQNQQLAQTLENRKTIERAKGIYMKRLQLDEAEAHRKLQQESQKRRINLVELAKKVIESAELLGG